MNKEQLRKTFGRFIGNSNGAWDVDNEIDYVKNLAYRDGAIDFYGNLLEEMERIDKKKYGKEYDFNVIREFLGKLNIKATLKPDTSGDLVVSLHYLEHEINRVTKEEFGEVIEPPHMVIWG